MSIGALQGRMAQLEKDRQRALALMQMGNQIAPQVNAGLSSAQNQYRANMSEGRSQKRFEDQQYDRSQELQNEWLSEAALRAVDLPEYDTSAPNPRSLDASDLGGPGPDVLDERSTEGTLAAAGDQPDSDFPDLQPAPGASPAQDAPPGAQTQGPDSSYAGADTVRGPGQWGESITVMPDSRPDVSGLAATIMANAKKDHPEVDFSYADAYRIASEHSDKIEAARKANEQARYSEMDRRKKEAYDDQVRDVSLSTKRANLEQKMEELRHGSGASTRTLFDFTVPAMQNYMDGKKLREGANAAEVNHHERGQRIADTIARHLGIKKSKGRYAEEDQLKIQSEMSKRMRKNWVNVPKNAGAKQYAARLLDRTDPPRRRAAREPKGISGHVSKNMRATVDLAHSVKNQRQMIHDAYAQKLDSGRVKSTIYDILKFVGEDPPEMSEWRSMNTVQFMSVLKTLDSRPSDRDMQLIKSALDADYMDQDTARRVLGKFGDRMNGKLDSSLKALSVEDPRAYAFALNQAESLLGQYGGIDMNYHEERERGVAMDMLGKHDVTLIVIPTPDGKAGFKAVKSEAGINYWLEKYPDAAYVVTDPDKIKRFTGGGN